MLFNIAIVLLAPKPKELKMEQNASTNHLGPSLDELVAHLTTNHAYSGEIIFKELKQHLAEQDITDLIQAIVFSIAYCAYEANRFPTARVLSKYYLAVTIPFGKLRVVSKYIRIILGYAKDAKPCIGMTMHTETCRNDEDRVYIFWINFEKRSNNDTTPSKGKKPKEVVIYNSYQHYLNVESAVANGK